MIQGVSSRIAILAGIAALALSVAGVLSFWTSSRQVSDARQIVAVSMALRNHSLANMLHDELRGSVYKAIKGGDILLRRQMLMSGKKNFLEQYQGLMSETKKLDLPADARISALSIEAPMTEFMNVGLDAVANAFIDEKDTNARLTDFEDKFQKLVDLQEAADEKLRAYATEIRANAEAFAKTSAWLSISSIIIVVCCLGALVWVAWSGLLKPINAIRRTMTALTEGNHGVEVAYAERNDEIGEMARAIKVFQENAISRTSLADQAETRRRQVEDSRQSADHERQRMYEKESADAHERTSFLSVLAKGLSELASGNLESEIAAAESSEYRQIAQDFNSMVGQLRAIVGRIGSASGAVQDATTDIGAGVSDLSSRTEQQASSLEETAASIEELAATVRQNADNAQEANQLAAAARQLAVGGGDIANRAVSAMDRIEQSSQRVSEIVGLIQEIAFQTNILALNAAVEAARAGEAGRGFAVVANEVRALAQRSAQASKEIKELITGTQQSVGEGVGLVKKAGVALNEILQSVRKVADIVSEIAAASREQTSGIDQVSQAISHMDEMTQQNVALVEETNSALSSARAQADELKEAVSYFDTGKKQHEQVTPADAGSKGDLEPPKPDVQAKLRELARTMAAKSSQSSTGTGEEGLPLAANADWKEF